MCCCTVLWQGGMAMANCQSLIDNQKSINNLAMRDYCISTVVQKAVIWKSKTPWV